MRTEEEQRKEEEYRTAWIEAEYIVAGWPTPSKPKDDENEI